MSDESLKEIKIGSGIGTISALGITFLILKLCQVIDWAWWLVLMPFWIPVALFVVLTLISMIGVYLFIKG